ncbi:MAG TPA: toll/interleukin-1 receptor domain-containing protein, partial [Bacteroidales bacterium]|nr:toll/interleukin-1 receptor domain-containing protein [Bacteroidales bacterium]
MKSIFISYCHEPSIYKELVHIFVDKLIKTGLSVVIDKYDLSPGNDMDSFMNDIINKEKYEKVLVFCTSEYKNRADNKIGGVGQEVMTYKNLVKDKPNQEYVIPIIIEPNIKGIDLLPNIFPKNTYYINISNDLKFSTQESLDLIHYLQGVKPRKPQNSVLEALVTYTLANFPGLPKPLVDLFKQEMSKWIVSSFTNSFGAMIQFNTWVNLSVEYEILNRIAPNIIEFSKNLSNPYVAIDLLSIFWKYFDNIPNNINALNIINEAISISDLINEKNTNLNRIKLNLEFKKAITLHRMDMLDDALLKYNLIIEEESQDLLDPITIFTSALYAGHIYKLKKD